MPRDVWSERQPTPMRRFGWKNKSKLDGWTRAVFPFLKAASLPARGCWKPIHPGEKPFALLRPPTRL